MALATQPSCKPPSAGKREGRGVQPNGACARKRDRKRFVAMRPRCFLLSFELVMDLLL
jgi:hypothetical protein